VEELGLFPLGIVLLPTERVPLHIFEPRYRELLRECIGEEREFGLVFSEDEALSSVGTRARVSELLEEFDDGRFNVIVTGGDRFRIVELTEGRTFRTANVEAFGDEEDEAAGEEATVALGAFRALAQIVEAEPEEPASDSPQLAFELAARVALPPAMKQQLLELRSERARLRFVAELLDATGRAAVLERELAERASRNGTRVHH
jgi:Lon protease-like protein